MRVGSTCHGDRSDAVWQAIVSFIGNRFATTLLLHIVGETAALNHEIIDNTVEDRAVIEAIAGILHEVRGGLWRFVEIQFNLDLAIVGIEYDHLISCVLESA